MSQNIVRYILEDEFKITITMYDRYETKLA